MRVTQSKGEKGSLKWIQSLMADHEGILTGAIRAAFEMPPIWTIEWISPLEKDDWAEYRDGTFLKCLRQEHLIGDLKSFWPSQGPQWDALGCSSDNGVVLVEAKSHTGEMRSSCSATSAKSLELINRSLDEVKQAYGAPTSSDWHHGFYQYANRLAHLHFLQRHGVNARLAFVYFVNDHERSGPCSVDEWGAAIATVHKHLGIDDLAGANTRDVFIDVGADLPANVGDAMF